MPRSLGNIMTLPNCSVLAAFMILGWDNTIRFVTTTGCLKLLQLKMDKIWERGGGKEGKGKGKREKRNGKREMGRDL